MNLARVGFLAAFVVVIGMTLWACNSSSSEDHATRDALGRYVALDNSPERVVSLAPSVTEMIFAAGGGPLLVGVSTADDYPPAVDTLPRFSSYPLNVEEILALEPDLVVGSRQVNAARDAEIFENLGVATFFLASETISGITDDLRHLGQLLGTEEQAGRAVSDIMNQLENLRAATDTISHRPRTLFLIGAETLYSFGSDSYIHELIAAAGGESLAADLHVRNPVLSTEYILEAQPEVIIGAFGQSSDPSRLERLHPTWQGVPAIEKGRVYSIDPDIVVRPGPRIVEGARRMAQMLHGIPADTLARVQ